MRLLSEEYTHSWLSMQHRWQVLIISHSRQANTTSLPTVNQESGVPLVVDYIHVVMSVVSIILVVGIY